MHRIVAAALLTMAAAVAHAQTTPVGVWKSVDDETKKEKSLVRITESGGVLTGRIEKLLDPDAKPDPKCDKCSDERKDKPVLGMTIIRNAKLDAEKEHWEGGDILDPNNGKVYRLRLKTLDGGKKLEVRGYIAMFYRNQIWHRVE